MSTSEQPIKQVDVVIVVDSTGSMDHYLLALTRVVPQLLAVRAFTSLIRRIGVLSYKDYYKPPVISAGQSSVKEPVPANDAAVKMVTPLLKIDDILEWSGWDEPSSQTNHSGTSRVLSEWVKGLVAEGGGDYPEAAKTALRRLLDLVKAPPSGSETQEVETFVIWYTDAPPHHRSVRGYNRLLEIEAHHTPEDEPLTAQNHRMNAPTPKPPAVSKERYLDWTYLCKEAKEARFRVYTILPSMTPVTDASFWIMLGEITDGGALLVGPVLDQNTLETQIVMSGGGPFVRGISNATVDLVLGYLGITAEGYKILRESEEETKDERVQWFRYEDDIKPYLRPKGGNEPPPHTNTGADAGAEPADEKEVEDVQLYIDDEDAGSRGFLPQPWHGPRFSDGSINATKYKVMKGDSSWRALLRNCSLVSPDAASTLLDSITGNTAEDKRDYTINLLKTIIEVDIEALLRVDWFSRIGKSVITKCTTNSQESFLALLMAHIDRHFDTNVQRMLRDWIEVVDPDTPSDIHRLMDTDPDASAETASVLILDADAPKLCGLVEADLLTVAGSYQKPTFEKIGNLLRYTRVLSRSAVTDDTRSIILTKEPLTTFRAIPHLAFQELVYAPRTAAILAMIAVTAHIPHLIRPAQAFLETTQGTWLNLRIPENFSTPFVTFLLAAPCSSSVLNAQEKETFTNMARYAHLEEQIDTKIQAKTPWTPMKTRGVGDRKRECAGCGIRRSETMMHQVGSYEYTRPDKLENGTGMRCGMCVDSDTKKPEDWKDKGEIASCWVECSERWCRAQYVIEDEEGLRIPPRCYYCRKRKPCPWIECTLCANRIILPKSYRNLPVDSLSSFTCPPCLNQKHTGHKSVVHKLTTLRSILFANDYEVGWLGIKPFREVFRGRTTFMLFELYGFDIFTPAPPAGQSPPPSPASDRGKTKRLLLQGKKLLNPAELKEELNGIIGRTMGRGRVICPITFNFVNEQDLLRACADVGCSFRASKEGLKRWFTGSSSDPRRAQCPACRNPHVVYS